MPQKDGLIYKLLSESEWTQFQQDGEFTGSQADQEDGFIHFSSAEQVSGTASKHFAHLAEVWLLTIDTGKVSGELKWEPSRGGALFPHLYANLPLSAVVESRSFTADDNGEFDFGFLDSSH